MINKDTLKLMKKGAVLINTSRGQLVDTKALIWALDKKILGGIGLDVLEGEDYLKDERQKIFKWNKSADQLLKLYAKILIK